MLNNQKQLANQEVVHPIDLLLRDFSLPARLITLGSHPTTDDYTGKSSSRMTLRPLRAYRVTAFPRAAACPSG
jgi:hypothetical protein